MIGENTDEEEAAMELMVYLFAAVVAIGIVSFVGLPVLRRQRPQLQVHEGLARVVVEYIGNVGFEEDGPFEGGERRHNKAARVLMNYVRGSSQTANVPAPEVESLVEELRREIRSAERSD